MKTKYSSDEILNMAVGLMKADLDADLDSDGKITSNDARLRSRIEEGLDKGNTDTLTASDILDRIIDNTNSFSYDFNVDPLYQHYRELYSEEGQRAAEDIFGLAASLTGGYGNSYGLTKAADVKKTYQSMMDSKAAELENQAYERYKDSRKELYEIFDAMREISQDASKEEKERFDRALETAKLGDFSALRELGIDTSSLASKNSQELAEFFAKYRDYSLLKDMGVDTAALERDELIKLAELFAEYGDYSLIKELGIDTTDREAADELERLIALGKLK